MIIHKVIEIVFGSPAKVKIIRALLKSPQPLSGRQVGELSGLTHRGAIQAMGALVELGVVQQRKAGKAYQYSFSKDNIYAEKIVMPCIKAEEGLFNELKRDITEYFGKECISLILYGSLAKEKEKKGSDIDILAVVKDSVEKTELEERAVSKVPYFIKRFNSLLSLHCLTINEVKNKKGLPLIKSASREGKTLSGKSLEELLK